MNSSMSSSMTMMRGVQGKIALVVGKTFHDIIDNVKGIFFFFFKATPCGLKCALIFWF